MDVANRQLDHPDQLLTGDIIRLGFLSPLHLGEARLEVSEIQTLDLVGSARTIFWLFDEADRRFSLELVRKSGRERLVLGRTLHRSQVNALLERAELARVFSDVAGVTLTRRGEPPELEGWTAASYVQEIDAARGYLLEGDYRKRPLPPFEEGLREVDYYFLLGEDERFALDAWVFETSETEIRALAFLALADIQEYWPKGEGL